MYVQGPHRRRRVSVEYWRWSSATPKSHILRAPRSPSSRVLYYSIVAAFISPWRPKRVMADPVSSLRNHVSGRDRVSVPQRWIAARSSAISAHCWAIDAETCGHLSGTGLSFSQCPSSAGLAAVEDEVVSPVLHTYVASSDTRWRCEEEPLSFFSNIYFAVEVLLPVDFRSEHLDRRVILAYINALLYDELAYRICGVDRVSEMTRNCGE